MFEYSIDEKDRPKSLALRGRVDALSSAEIQKVFDRLIQAGERMILVDFAEVNYVSSAGLRLFLLVQKQLKSVGGELLLFGLASQTRETFRTGSIFWWSRRIPITSSPAWVLRSDKGIG